MEVGKILPVEAAAMEYFQEILWNRIICEQDLRSKQDHY